MECFALSVVALAVADPGFFRRGAPTPKSVIIFQFFCRKLHEDERIWTPEGASLAPPLDPPMFSHHLTKHQVHSAERPIDSRSRSK